MSLKMWSNEFDYVISETLEEAIEVTQKTMGYDPLDYEELEWYEMTEDQNFTFRNDDGTNEVKTVGEWIKEHGAGYFACSEY